jgi:DNA-binding CsgD family transcriptional regulator/tetratricopeptide (TPR) repeat protein
MPTRLSSRRFVGRSPQLAQLERAAREAASGRPTLVLLGGDSGVGKTRLVAEFEHRLGDEGDAQLILHGDGVEQIDGELPYAPLLGALRPVVRARHEALDRLSVGTRTQLATILPGLDEDPGRQPEPNPGSGAQLRLFDSVLALLDALSEDSPVILVLEDMHWADRSTRSFVTFLARSMRSERLVLVLTYRTDELHRRHPLRPLLAELERLERAVRVELRPFDRQELAEALSDILGAAPDPAQLERLFARGEGNPLYTEELLAAGLDGRGAPPESLRGAFLARIERLSPDAQRIARAISAGRSLDEGALADVTGLDRDALSAALREAVAEQVLIPDSEGRFAFRHALLREAISDDLLPGERGGLHLALARYLEDSPPVPGSLLCDALERSATVASHYAAAGDQPAALRTTVRAAVEAWRAQAYSEVADLYQRALELWPRVPDAEQIAGHDHVAALIRAAVALSVGDDRTRAESLLRQALDELDPETDPARYGGALGRLARMQWSLNRGDEAVATGERALAMIPEEDPRHDRVLIRAWLARVQTLRGRYREAIVDGEAALKAAVADKYRGAEIELLNTLGMARVAVGEGETGIELLRHAIALAQEFDDTDRLATAWSNLADQYGILGRAEEAVQTATEGLAHTPRDHVRNRDWLTLTLGEHAFLAGRWELARECLNTPKRDLIGLPFILRQLREAELALGTGDEDLALESLKSIAEQVAQSTQPQCIGPFGALSAEAHARRGELAEAQQAAQHALDQMEVCTDDIARIARVSVAGLRVEADRAQRARDLGETAMRRDALARAKLHLDRVDAAAQDGGAVEAARLAQGKAEMARARGRGAARAWALSAAAWEALPWPYEAATARWRQAECLVADGDRDGAGRAATAALATAQRLGSLWLEREVRGLCDRARLSLGEGIAAPATPAVAPPEDPFGLTARERQVLALVAQGATNRQIGASLYMAEKTASVHVSRILAKLDVQGRTEAAAVAHRLHLA